MSIKPTHSTIGRSNLAAEMSGGYVWNGDPDKAEKPADPDAPRRDCGSPARRREERLKRYARFRELMDDGATVAEAIADPGVGVQPKTGRSYLRQYKAEREAAS